MAWQRGQVKRSSKLAWMVAALPSSSMTVGSCNCDKAYVAAWVMRHHERRRLRAVNLSLNVTRVEGAPAPRQGSTPPHPIGSLRFRRPIMSSSSPRPAPYAQSGVGLPKIVNLRTRYRTRLRRSPNTVLETLQLLGEEPPRCRWRQLRCPCPCPCPCPTSSGAHWHRI